MPKIREIFSQAFGLSSEEKLNSLARILYHYEFDGIKRRLAPNDSNLKEILDKETSEKDLNGLLQEHIFQKIRGSGERQQIDPSNHFSDETKQQLMQDFEKIGFVAEVSPESGKEYESVIIFGASQKGMENRLNDFLRYFLPKINENPKEIFFLVGERDAWLDSEIFAKEILLERINRSPKINGINEKTPDDLNKEIQFISKIILDERRRAYFLKEYNITLSKETDINKETLLKDINQFFKNNDKNEKNLDDLNKEIEGIPKITVNELRSLEVAHFTKTYGIKFPTETDIAKEIFKSIKKQVNDFDITSVDNENSARIKDLVNNIKITFIDAKRKPDGSRPDTTHTLKAFIEKVEPRKVFNFNAGMAISDQPYVSSQAMALKVDERLCGIDVVGKEGSRQVGQLNILACESAGRFNRYFALSKEQQQGIKSDKPPSFQRNPSQATANRGNDGKFLEQVEAPSFVGRN